MKHTIRQIILFFTLVIGSIGHAWAITESDIIINIQPNNSAGTVSVTGISGMTVTISATPATGYSIDAAHILAEKMVDPFAAAPRRAAGIASKLDITDNGGNSFSFTIPDGYDGAYVTVNFYKKTEGFIQITSLSDITDLNGNYQLTTDVSGVSSSLGEFTGTLDGGLHKVYNLSKPLFSSTNGAVIRNIIFEDVNISSGDTDGDAGAVTSKAGGDTRIYNCGILPTSAERDNEGNITGFYGSSVSGTRYVGGLVGFLDGTSRVINCYSYANVSGGSYVGGIVGYNNVATTATNLKTMVMNCMFYGEVSGSSIAPIYNGAIITNVGENTGVSNYNYFRLESSYIQNTAITKVYNCALGAETRFLQRFEFYRHVLNSHRELAAWWATGSMDNKDEMMKWVLEPAQISSSAPFPILKAPGYYPSVVNIDAENAPTTTERNKGGKLGTLSVTIQSGSGEVFSAPTGAAITTSSLTLNITDKDFDHFNFNYYKVQLPYYNDVGTGNYTGNRVVTGWKIVAVSGGTAGTFNEADEWGGYNFADRKCTNKDLYSVSKRVFSQGAYWDVPEGVTGITIQPYWAKAAYVADAYPDVVYNTDMSTAYNVPDVGGGEKYKNNTNYNIAGEQQRVFTSIYNAVTNTNGLNKPTGNTVHDYAVVLVGNVHQYTTNNTDIGSTYKYTVTTIDLDHDNEPDYSLMLRDDGRNKLHPAKWDFLNIVGLGMAQKSTGAKGTYNLGILQPRGWFEVTNTSLFRITQLEYEKENVHGSAPYIIQGGVMEQWVSGQQNASPNNITYFHVGGNVWFKEFHRGVHQDRTASSNHPPISVTGGDFDEFYLTGLYRGDVASYEDNAECYINGGRFGVVAGAAMEGIGKADGADDTGNITWQIQNADIKEFYGGGINADHPVEGNISTTITGGKIDLFCGGPKFGDMNTGKTVVTNAAYCEFGTFYGAGYGGSSYSRRAPRNIVNMYNMPATTGDSKHYNSWNAWVSAEYKQQSATGFPGISTRFNYQFIPNSGNSDNVGRLFVEHIQFSLATCRNVTSTLTGCKITGNFYGGGNLGKVDGSVTSSLTDCDVTGNVFGAGFSASLPTVEVDSVGFRVEPYYYEDLGTYRIGVKGKTTTYKWAHGDAIGIDTGNKILYTTENLDGLGAVTGTATLTIDGTTTVAESVYGGGEESGVDGNTSVTVTGGTIGTTGKGGATWGNVYGGGKGKEKDVKAGLVKGNTTVSISGSPTIIHNVYGGGAYGSVGDFTYDSTTGMPTALATANTGVCTVTITGGTFGSNGHENGMVFGSSRGDVAVPEGEPAVDPNDRMAWVYSTHVTIGDTSAETSPTIKDSVYGSGENGHTFQNTVVDINKGKIGITDTNIDGGAAYAYRGNVYGGGCGTDMYDSNDDGIKDKYNPLAGIVQGTTTVNITGGHVVHNVYGAGAMGSVGGGAEANSGKTTINVTGGRIGYDGDGNGHVFGAARGEVGVSTAASGLANVRETEVNINYATTPAADNEGKTEQLIAGTVFGGGEAGTVKESVAVNMRGGLILKDVYGGGALADTQTDNWDATANENAGGWADAEKKSALHTTTVRLTGGRVGEEVFGGGLGEAGKPAYVWGDVLVDLNGTTSSGTTGTPIADDAKGCAVGQIFGCNNINGTPKGDVMVHVYATQSPTKADISTKPEKNTDTYDVTAVYGGGNQAAYNPVTPYDGTSGAKTQVLIEGCALTSINTVYGGGNAAAVPETNVVIKGAYEIGYLFGGGNGKDDIAPGVANPGADVGTLDHGTTIYGTGNANTLMEGGLIHEAYGGSNTRGTIKGSINQTTNPKASTDPGYCCDLEVEKIVGAGKYADIDGDVNMDLSCQPSKKVDLLFAGADEANVNGNITLNITNGHFGKVFGGNNLGGAIKGKITVNVEETGCQPIKIDDLYLGSNEAPYSVFGYYESEDIHPVTGKKILKPRESATDPRKPVKYDGTEYASISDFTNYDQPELNIISCTYIGNVFGGGFGKGAVMYANPTVNVNMEPGNHAATAVPAMMDELELDVTKTAPNPDKLGIIRNVFGGGDAANIAGDTYVNIATEANKSAYIIGSVFGGGNAADVLGNTNVTVSDGYVFNGIFGGGYAGSVGTFTRSTAAEDVNIYGHTAHDDCIGKPVSCAENTGKCTVVVNGGQIGPLSVATQGMNRSKAEGGPVPEGWVWGAGQGLVEDPATHPDTHFTSYVGSTDVTIGGTALIMESIIGGGEFGRVLGNTLVKIEGGQIGIGEGMVDGNNKPIRYTDDQFVNPLTTTITNANALAECSHYPYGRDTNNDGKPDEFLPYDPYYEDYSDYVAAHPEFGPASTSNPSDGKTWIGCVFAGGSGYMPYKNASGYDWVRSAGWVEGNSEVRISGGHILTNVYGGNEITDVKGKSIVKMTGGTIGVPRTLEQIVKHPLTCYLFGAGKGDERSRFYDYTITGSVEVEISGGIIYGSVFGGSEDGHVTGDIKMDIKPGAIIGTWGTSYVDGNVFGGGRGFSGNTLTAGNVGGNVTLNITGGNILGSVYGGGRLASVGTYLVPSGDANYGKQIPDNGNEKHGHITINISGGTIGNDKEYIYNPTAEQKAAIPNTTFDYQNHLQYTKGGNVFTGGMGRLYALNNTTVLTSWQKLGQCKQTVLNMTGGTVKSSVYGGGEIGIVAQSATVNIDGGTVGTKVVDSGDATKNYYFGSVFGGGKGSTENIDGISAAGTTEGNVEVHLNKTVASNDAAKGAIVNQVFGCNDMNGSPKGTVTVHVYATQSPDKDNISTKPAKGTETFDVEAVYGGGNLATYEPEGGKNTTKSTNVIIDGCGLTSVRQVYGGGNAASTPATNVVINGTYEIEELFGGGNGLDKLPDGRPNPGANVGYKNYTVYEQVAEEWVAKDDPAYDTKEERTAGNSAITYGTGQASINVFGGTIHRVFGGSNTKGNVRQTAVTLLDENSGCEFCVDEAYGGGKSAPMDAEAKLLMACIPGLNAVYGGAEAAAIQGNVTLNITNGTFDRVFGGNNLSGTINGSITVNIEEIGCRPIKIGELYGGGNQAGYSVYGYNADGSPKESGTKIYEDPQVNVKSFTSIGKVFGGGYGDGATMVGNPTVNVNEVYGKWYNDDTSVVGEDAKTSGNYPIPSHAKGKMGAISEIFGGGNAAKVIGSTTVNIATLSDVFVVKQVTAGAALPAGCYTRSGAGTDASPYVYTLASGTAEEHVTYYEKRDVLGADIRGNVYGGGNNAEVTGNANVTVGKRNE
ncbi:MAG: hypothetical protein J6T05_02910 [Prevotella sp.]|nr:hypothetical protein [Prevotella sp.]